jgi:hypothetical protein
MEMTMICWICNADNAISREHKIKKSDLKTEINSISQNTPLYLSYENIRNKKIGCLNSNNLKYQHRICHDCNTSKTQKNDLA